MQSCLINTVVPGHKKRLVSLSTKLATQLISHSQNLQLHLLWTHFSGLMQVYWPITVSIKHLRHSSTCRERDNIINRLWFRNDNILIPVAVAYLQSLKIWNRVDCQHSEKRSETHKRLKEHFLIRRNRTKRANFRGKPLFQATYNKTTEKS